MATRKLSVEITGDARGGVNAMRSVSSSADSMGGKLQSVGGKIGSIFKGIAIGAAAGAVVVGGFLMDSVAAARESAKINAETARVIQTTGAASWGASADAVADYSAKLASLTGVDDEVIQSGSNLLLTFTNIQNKIGAGNDVFNQAVTLANDMSVALGTDMSSASMQLGKALNDPTKGLSALSRAGVSFTQQQKDQIKAMQASGDMLGAQKIILSELGREFGGAAKAAATPMDRLKVTIGNLQEEIGAKLIPVIDKVAVWLSDKVPVALNMAGKLFAALGREIEKIRPYLDDIAEGFASAFAGFMPMAEAIAKFVQANPEAAFAALAVVIGGALATALWAAGSAMIALFSPVYLIIAAVALLAGGFVLAYQKLDWFKTGVDAVAGFLTDTLWPALQVVAGFIASNVIPIVLKLAQLYYGTLWKALQLVAGFIMSKVVPAFQAVASFIMGTVVPAVQSLWRWVQSNLLPVLRSVASVIVGQVVSAFSRAKAGIDLLIGAAMRMYSFFQANVMPILRSVGSVVAGAFATGFGNARRTVDAVRTAVNYLVDAIRRAIAKVSELAGKAKSGLGGIAGFALGGGSLGFANGGRPPVGVASWVGERGKELFVPDQPGTIIPNHRINTAAPVGGGRAGSTTIIVNIQAGMVASKEQVATEVVKSIRDLQRLAGARPLLPGVSG